MLSQLGRIRYDAKAFAEAVILLEQSLAVERSVDAESPELVPLTMELGRAFRAHELLGSR